MSFYFYEEKNKANVCSVPSSSTAADDRKLSRCYLDANSIQFRCDAEIALTLIEKFLTQFNTHTTLQTCRRKKRLDSKEITNKYL